MSNSIKSKDELEFVNCYSRLENSTPFPVYSPVTSFHFHHNLFQISPLSPIIHHNVFLPPSPHFFPSHFFSLILLIFPLITNFFPHPDKFSFISYHRVSLPFHPNSNPHLPSNGPKTPLYSQDSMVSKKPDQCHS